jgi:hypothetical protein
MAKAEERGQPMSVTSFGVGVGVLIAFSLLAIRRNYQLTSIGLMVATGVLATTLAAAFWLMD